jgi:hypothetical protein
MMERKVFAVFTDWEFSDINAMQATGTAMWPKMQAAGAISFKATSTGATTARTMVTWPAAATAQAAIDDLRAVAMEMTDTKSVAKATGEVMLDFSYGQTTANYYNSFCLLIH